MNDFKGFWFFLASIPMSAAIAICGMGSCIARSDEARYKAQQDYYNRVAGPTATEWAKQGVKNINVN